MVHLPTSPERAVTREEQGSGRCGFSCSMLQAGLRGAWLGIWRGSLDKYCSTGGPRPVLHRSVPFVQQWLSCYTRDSCDSTRTKTAERCRHGDARRKYSFACRENLNSRNM